MSTVAARNHQALAGSIIMIYLILSFVSIQAHAKRGKYSAVQMRIVALLREAARASVASENSNLVDDRYAESCKAQNYVTCVQTLLPADEIGRLAGTNIDQLRTHVDKKLARARTELNKQCSSKQTKLQASYHI
jgi:hypothetical protein